MEAFKKSSTREEFVNAYRDMVEEYGIQALSSKWLKNNHVKSQYNKGLKHGLKLDVIAEILKKSAEYLDFQTEAKKNIKHFTIWTPELVEQTAKSLIQQHGQIPPVEWLQKNGLWGFDEAVRNRFGGIEALRQKYQENGVRNVSRAGLFHRSMAETSFANFLWSRGIKIYIGGRYPTEYEIFSGNMI